MSTISGIFKVNADGNVVVSVGPERAGSEVQVTVETMDARRADVPMTDEQWRAAVASTAGSIEDPTFRRHEQGRFEGRLDLE